MPTLVWMHQNLFNKITKGCDDEKKFLLSLWQSWVRESVCECVLKERESECECVWKRERERVCVWVCEKERECVCVCMIAFAQLWVQVCVRCESKCAWDFLLEQLTPKRCLAHQKSISLLKYLDLQTENIYYCYCLLEKNWLNICKHFLILWYK